jgi:hypothetical protein
MSPVRPHKTPPVAALASATAIATVTVNFTSGFTLTNSPAPLVAANTAKRAWDPISYTNGYER